MRIRTYSRREACALAGATALAASGLGPTRAWSAADPAIAKFYKGKQLTFIVGSDPGGGYDLLARLVARHLPDFIPGNPTVVVQNMPGAGSVLMSNLIYNTAPQDGTVLGLVQRGVLLSQLTHQPGVRYEVGKFNWIGSVNAEDSLAVSWHASPVKTFQDLLSHELVVGGTGSTSDTESSARILNALAGAKFKIVSGYPGTADVLLAVERGELQGVADLSWSELKANHSDLVNGHDFNYLAQNALTKAADLPDAPLAIDFIKTDKPVAELYYAVKGVARPILMGPKVPAERIAAMRASFDAAVASPAFKQDAAKLKLNLRPADYKTVDAFVAKTQATTPHVVKVLTQILNVKH